MTEALERLAAGGLVAFPTETVYGLGADALSPQAVARVFAVKGRPAHNPLIVHVADPAMAGQVVRHWPPQAEELARRFWPGPLTLVLPRAEGVPEAVTAGGDLVAVRCPDHPLTLELLRRFGRPLVGPSANRSGSVSPTTAEHVRQEFSSAEVLVLDGGPCRAGIESTVLLVGPPAVILRPGLIGPSELGLEVATEGGPSGASPGQLDRHYAPRTPAVRLRPEQWPRLSGRLALLAERCLEPPPALFLAMPGEPRAYAEQLYARLREADAAGVDTIAVIFPEERGDLWDAVRDRLRRATTPLTAGSTGAETESSTS